MSKGVVFVVTGDDLIQEASESAKRIKDITTKYPITLIADQQHDSNLFDTYIPIDDPRFDISDKHLNIHRSPYDQTLYFDSDTYIVDEKALDDLFALLHRFDVVGALDTGRRWELFANETASVNAPSAFPMLNSGVLGFRSTPDVNELFSSWRQVYSRLREDADTAPENVPDQAAFREALYHSDVSFATLGPEYNFRIPFVQLLNGEVKILHGRASNPKELARSVNEDLGGRVYIPLHGSGEWWDVGNHRVIPVILPWTRPNGFFPFFKKLHSEDGTFQAFLYLLAGGPIEGLKKVGLLRTRLSEDGVLAAGKSVIRYGIKRISRI